MYILFFSDVVDPLLTVDAALLGKCRTHFSVFVMIYINCHNILFRSEKEKKCHIRMKTCENCRQLGNAARQS